jgi:hypothetical protein
MALFMLDLMNENPAPLGHCSGARFMPIYLARAGIWRMLWLLTELSLPGVRLPLAWAVPPSYSLLFKARAAMAAQTEQETDTESIKL